MRLMATADEVTGPINLGNPGEFTIRELAEKVIELTGSRSRDRRTGRCPGRSDASASPTSRQAQGAARLGADGRRSRRG